MRVAPADRTIMVAALLVVIGSAAALADAVSAEPWVRFAARLETAAAPLDMPEGVRTRLNEHLSRRNALACHWQASRARVTIGLELVRRTMAPELPQDRRERALQDAEAAVRDGIRCDAADGNLWYLLSLLEYRAASDWGKVEPFLMTSALLAPFEGDLLLRRAQLLVLALRERRVELHPSLKTDLRHAIALSRVVPAAAILAGLREAGWNELADTLVADLPEERRAALAAGGAPQRSTFGRPERYRHFEFRPFGETGP